MLLAKICKFSYSVLLCHPKYFCFQRQETFVFLIRQNRPQIPSVRYGGFGGGSNSSFTLLSKVAHENLQMKDLLIRSEGRRKALKVS